MKKLLSVFCLAILAGGLIFTSCTKKQFTITVQSNNDAWGTVTGGGTFADQTTTTLTATAKAGYEFEKWQDGSKENPRTITVTADETWIAYFKEVEPEPEPQPQPGQDPTPPTPPTPTTPGGVAVNFNNSIWQASNVYGAYYTDYGAWDILSCEGTTNDYPKADVAAYATAPGSYSDATADGQNYNNEVVAWLEYYENTTLQDQQGYSYGDWWAKSANINVSAFDATALTMSATVSTVMFSAYEAFVQGVGFAAAPKVGMSAGMVSVQMDAAKNVPMKKRSTKLFPVK